MSKQDVIRITDQIDHDALQARVGVGPRSIRLARERGVFPASWFNCVEDMCKSAGIECPRSAFNWKDEGTSGSSATATPEGAAQ